MKKLIFFISIVLFASSLNAHEAATYRVQGRKVRAVRGELLVRFREGVSEERKNSAIASHRGRGARALGRTGIMRIEVPDHSLEQVMEALNRNHDVEYAGPNLIYSALKLPDIYPDIPSLESSQWGLSNIQAPGAWDIETGDGSAVIAVIDDGVYLSHPDLEGNVWQNPETERTWEWGGYEVRYDTHGWNFVRDESNNFDGCNDPNPVNLEIETHGTHVAGIAAASGSLGSVGVSWGNRIMALRVLSYTGDDANGDPIIEGSGDRIYAAIMYAADNGAHVINMSFGQSIEDPILEEVINYAYSRGCVLVAASGNTGGSAILYPAAYENVIAVGASDIEDNRAWFSSYGSGLDLMAPGVGIFSTVTGDPPHGHFSGTSMAAPFVSGLASIMISYQNDRGAAWTPEEIRRALVQQADALTGGGYPDRCFQTGYGRVNAFKTMSFISRGGFASEPIDPVVFPNPFNPHREYAMMKLSERNNSTLKEFRIYSLNGRLVRRQTDLSGDYAVWDGRNNSGDLCASGLYFFRLITFEGDNEAGKVTILR